MTAVKLHHPSQLLPLHKGCSSVAFAKGNNKGTPFLSVWKLELLWLWLPHRYTDRVMSLSEETSSETWTTQTHFHTMNSSSQTGVHSYIRAESSKGEQKQRNVSKHWDKSRLLSLAAGRDETPHQLRLELQSCRSPLRLKWRSSFWRSPPGFSLLMFYRYYDQTEGRVSDMGPCFYSHWSVPVFLWAKLKSPADSGPSPWGALETQDEPDIWWWWQSSPKNSNSSAVKVEVRGTFTAVTEWVLTEKHWTSFNDVVLLPFVGLQISNLKKKQTRESVSGLLVFAVFNGQ